MPSKKSHVAAAKRNQATIDYLLQSDDHLPWVVAVAFYKALHIVEAVFASDPRGAFHTNEHKKRNETLKTTTRYKHLWENYRPLYEASLIARYLQFSAGASIVDVFSTYMPREVVEKQMLGHHLHQVQLTAGRLLSDPKFLD